MEEIVAPMNEQPILGVLQQIKKVNYMIDLHKLHDQESIAKQYERQREGFLEELTQLLIGVRIQADLKALATA
jgi:hypothetical protein